MGDPTTLFTLLELKAFNEAEARQVIEDAKTALDNASPATLARVIILERDPSGGTVSGRDLARRGLKHPELSNKKAETQ